MVIKTHNQKGIVTGFDPTLLVPMYYIHVPVYNIQMP